MWTASEVKTFASSLNELAIYINIFKTRRSRCYLALAFGTAGSSTTWVHTTELYSTDIRSTAHTLAFIVGRFGGFASGYVVENANSIPFATTVLIIMAALSALGTLTLRETMGERLS